MKQKTKIQKINDSVNFVKTSKKHKPSATLTKKKIGKTKIMKIRNERNSVQTYKN